MKSKFARPKHIPVPAWWIKGSDIPELVDPEFYDTYYSPEEVEDMRYLESIEYTPEQMEQFKKEKERLDKELHGADVYSVDKDGNKTLIMKWWKRVAKKSISLRLHEEDIQWIKIIAEKEGLPYQTFISSLLHKVATGQIQV